MHRHIVAPLISCPTSPPNVPEFSLSRDAAGLIDVGYTSTNIGAARNHFDSALIERLIEHGDECFADLVRFTVDAVDHANRDF